MVKKNGKNWKKSINQSLYHAIQKHGNKMAAPMKCGYDYSAHCARIAQSTAHLAHSTASILPNLADTTQKQIF
jgi:hypothetical protein